MVSALKNGSFGGGLWRRAAFASISALITGPVGYVWVQFLLAMGIPLKPWGQEMADFVALTISSNQAFWAWVVFFATGFWLVSLFLISRLLTPSADVSRAQAELKKQTRLQHKQDQLDKGLRGPKVNVGVADGKIDKTNEKLSDTELVGLVNLLPRIERIENIMKKSLSGEA